MTKAITSQPSRFGLGAKIGATFTCSTWSPSSTRRSAFSGSSRASRSSQGSAWPGVSAALVPARMRPSGAATRAKLAWLREAKDSRAADSDCGCCSGSGLANMSAISPSRVKSLAISSAMALCAWRRPCSSLASTRWAKPSCSRTCPRVCR